LPSPKELRMTRQRRTIMDVLENGKDHPPADEIYKRVRRRLPRISLGTVYRNLDLLAEHGMIRKLEFAGSQRRFDGKTDNHYHVRCTACGRVEDAPLDPMTGLEDGLRNATDYWSEFNKLTERRNTDGTQWIEDREEHPDGVCG